MGLICRFLSNSKAIDDATEVVTKITGWWVWIWTGCKEDFQCVTPCKGNFGVTYVSPMSHFCPEVIGKCHQIGCTCRCAVERTMKKTA